MKKKAVFVNLCAENSKLKIVREQYLELYQLREIIKPSNKGIVNPNKSELEPSDSPALSSSQEKVIRIDKFFTKYKEVKNKFETAEPDTVMNYFMRQIARIFKSFGIEKVIKKKWTPRGILIDKQLSF